MRVRFLASVATVTISGPRNLRIGFRDNILKGILVDSNGRGVFLGPDGQSIAILVVISEETIRNNQLGDAINAIIDIGRECGVQPRIRVDARFGNDKEE